MSTPILDPQDEKERDIEHIQQYATAIHNRAQQGRFTSKEDVDTICKYLAQLSRKLVSFYSMYGQTVALTRTESMTVERTPLENSWINQPAA
jgi:hypothetical protein